MMRLKKTKKAVEEERLLVIAATHDKTMEQLAKNVIGKNDKIRSLNRDVLIYGLVSAMWVTDIILSATGVLQLKYPERAGLHYAIIGSLALFNAVRSKLSYNRSKEYQKIVDDDTDEIFEKAGQMNPIPAMRREKKGL